ncbi:hypothetical protein JCM8547_003811, partial [Rhodosporidiobolus lusitaniae]
MLRTSLLSTLVVVSAGFASARPLIRREISIVEGASSYYVDSCWSNDGNTILPQAVSTTSRTVDACLSACYAISSDPLGTPRSYCGITSGGDCFTAPEDAADTLSVDLSSSIVYDVDDCSGPCDGDVDESCGTSDKVLVYRLVGGEWNPEDDTDTGVVPTSVPANAPTTTIIRTDITPDYDYDTASVPATTISTETSDIITSTSSSTTTTSTSFPSSLASSTSTTTTSTSASAAATSAVATGTKITSDPSWKYKGCYSDSRAARTLIHGISSSTWTAQNCLDLARGLNYTYAGIITGGECWGSNEIASTGQLEDASMCNWRCNDSPNSSITCGSSDGLDVYEKVVTPVGKLATDGNYGYLGCYTDSIAARALPNGLYSKLWTAENCLALAAAKGYRYAGMITGGECWGANAISSTSSEQDVSICNWDCNDDPKDEKTTCGSAIGIDIYEARPNAAFLTASTSSSASASASSTSSTPSSFVTITRSTLTLAASSDSSTHSSSPGSTTTSSSTTTTTTTTTTTSTTTSTTASASATATLVPNKVNDDSRWTYNGCYKDYTVGRTLPTFIQSKVWTARNCLELAAAAGYKHAGVETGGECWAANQITYLRYPQDVSLCSSLCNDRTTGDKTTCGAVGYIDVYTSTSHVASVGTSTVSKTITETAATSTQTVYKTSFTSVNAYEHVTVTKTNTVIPATVTLGTCYNPAADAARLAKRNFPAPAPTKLAAAIRGYAENIVSGACSSLVKPTTYSTIAPT